VLRVYDSREELWGYAVGEVLGGGDGEEKLEDGAIWEELVGRRHR
jgi:hypothetical protein